MGPWWFVASGALGAPVDNADAQAMVDELVPVLEARTRRRFVTTPRVGITDRESLRTRLLRPSGLALAMDGRAPDVPREVRRLVEPVVSDALAVYAPYDERIYLVQEAFDELGESFDLGADTIEPLLKCVLSHEMVHVLQHQYGLEEAVTASRRRGQKAIREGHASYVSHEYCAAEHGEGIVRLMETVQGIELEASLGADDDAAVYGWGRSLAGTLDAEGLLWASLRAPAPEWSAIVEAVEPTLPPDWRRSSPMLRALSRLGDELVVVDVAPVSPTTLLSPFFGSRWGLDALPRARGGFALQAVHGAHDVLIVAFLLDTRDTAAGLVQGRGALLDSPGATFRAWGEDTGPLVRRPRSAAYPQALRDDRVRAALRLTAKTRDDGPYTEAWFATERRLFVVMASGTRPSPRALASAVEPMMNAMSARSGAELGLVALESWIRRAREVDERATSEPSWQYRLHQAARRLELGDDAGCRDVFAPRLSEGAVVDLPGHARAAFECASVPLDLELALEALSHLDEVPVEAAIRLASGAVDEDRPRLALTFLADVSPAANLAVDVATVELLANVRLRRWRDVEELVQRNPILPGRSRAFAGNALYDAGRRRAGLAMMTAACPELSGDERRQCDAFVARHTP